MFLGIPRGFFYYDYISFAEELFRGTDVTLVPGMENSEDILSEGSRLTVDEACFTIKLFTGQVSRLSERCDKVLIPRIMKDCSGRWLCPKLMGLPELSVPVECSKKTAVTEPVYFNDRKKAEKAFRKLCSSLGIKRDTFEKNFERAYGMQKRVAEGMENIRPDASWRFIPQPPQEGEIILPNTSNVLLLGHCYNIYDKFSNCNIIEKLDNLAIGTVMESSISNARKEAAVRRLRLAKKPFWESFIRNVGTAVELKDEVDGIIYLSSFSCGPDAVIAEMVKKYSGDTPVMILKLDEHRGEAGLETRLEAFADLLDRRRYVC